MAKLGVDHGRTMKIEMTGPHWLIQEITGRLLGQLTKNHRWGPINDPDGQEVQWLCNIRNDSHNYAGTEPYGKISCSESSPYDLTSATFVVQIPSPAPPKPSITDLVAKWRATFAPADREALWKAIEKETFHYEGGRSYRARPRLSSSDESYSIETW